MKPNEETPLQKAWSSIHIVTTESTYIERGDVFLKFEYHGKKYKVEIKEVK